LIYFLPTFNFCKVGFLSFFEKLGRFLKIVRTIFWVFAQKKWPKAHFYFKSGHAETQYSCGFAGLKPTCPLLFSINCDKKIKEIYRYGQNKWAFDHKCKKLIFFTNSIGHFSYANLATRKKHALL